jgi:general secretion pathway protein N
MPSLRTLVIAGMATLVVALLIAFPARLAWQWIAPSGVALQGISGSVWNGQAREASAGGLYLADVRWRFRPFAILAGRIEYAVSAAPVAGFIEADVSILAGGTTGLENVAASLPIAALGPFIEVTGLDGEVHLEIDRLLLRGGLPIDADGRVALSGLIIRPLAPSVLGDFQASVATADGVVRGTVEDLSGVLDVTGAVELRPDRSYSFTGLIATRPGAPHEVDRQLQYLGSADAEGRRSFRLEGQL